MRVVGYQVERTQVNRLVGRLWDGYPRPSFGAETAAQIPPVQCRSFHLPFRAMRPEGLYQCGLKSES